MQMLARVSAPSRSAGSLDPAFKVLLTVELDLAMVA